jgi:REP-associated tyrosine transposase
MARKRRAFEAGWTFHVYQRSVNRETVFDDDNDRERFLSCVRSASNRYGSEVHGFAVMSTHYHLLVTPSTKEAVPKTVKQFAGEYAQYYNRKHGRTGHVWGGRYSVQPIGDEYQLLTCLRYIDNNPVAANIVDSPEKYRWSSFRAHGYGIGEKWLVDHPTYLALGTTAETRRAVYRALCDVI